MSDIERELGLSSERLAELALLLGSDYTEVQCFRCTAANDGTRASHIDGLYSSACPRSIILDGKLPCCLCLNGPSVPSGSKSVRSLKGKEDHTQPVWACCRGC